MRLELLSWDRREGETKIEGKQVGVWQERGDAGGSEEER